MAFLFGCEQIRYEVPAHALFENLSLGVNGGQRIGAVGANGSGKSSLLNLLSKKVEPDEGRVLYTRNLAVAYLAQQDALDPKKTVIENIVGDAAEYEWAGNPRTRAILDGLLFDVDVSLSIDQLSGGQRRRVDLARALSEHADVLLLDEPTNHLDTEGISWLAHFLQHDFASPTRALILVTHDRWFLDEVCTNMWEIHDGTIDAFEGGYSAYIQQRAERQRLQQAAEEKRQNLARRELAWLSRGPKARSTKPKFRLKAAQELIAQEPPIREEISLRRAAIARMGKQGISLKNISYSYPHASESILRNIDWEIGPGDRFALLGANGVGKSTLLNIIQGHLAPTEGSMRIGKTIAMASLSQRLDELECYADERVMDVLKRYKTRYLLDGKEISSSDLFEQLGFKKGHLKSFVKDLSGGQKRRLQLMLLLLQEPNVLILDEPSNDLDTDMMIAMENVLDTWPGTLIIVSHDRYLVERVTDDQYALIDGKLTHLPRGVDEYLELVSAADPAQRNSATLRLQQSADSQAVDGAYSHTDSDKKPVARISATQAHALRKKLGSLERRMDTLDKKIAQAQEELSNVEPSDYEALMAAQKNLTELEQNKAALEDEWLEASLELDPL